MNNLKWKPCGWRIVIDPEYKKVTDWGLEIIQPDRTGIAATTKGRVVAVGDAAFKDQRYHGVWCKVGDVVLYARHGGIIVEDPDTQKKYVICNDEDLLGVFESDKE
jgi:co-chaperonin GroES (HSP10)